MSTRYWRKPFLLQRTTTEVSNSERLRMAFSYWLPIHERWLGVLQRRHPELDDAYFAEKDRLYPKLSEVTEGIVDDFFDGLPPALLELEHSPIYREIPTFADSANNLLHDLQQVIPALYEGVSLIEEYNSGDFTEFCSLAFGYCLDDPLEVYDRLILVPWKRLSNLGLHGPPLPQATNDGLTLPNAIHQLEVLSAWLSKFLKKEESGAAPATATNNPDEVLMGSGLPSSVYRLLELLDGEANVRHNEIAQELRNALRIARNRGLVETQITAWGEDVLRYDFYCQAVNPAYWLSSHGKDELAMSRERLADQPAHSGMRVYIEDIDSFHKVRDVAHSSVQHLLTDEGYFEKPEDDIQRALEAINGEPFHKKDWGGELNDLYTSNLKLNGKRVTAAFLLKGSGLRKRVMNIANCGKGGDQLNRLFDSPAQLFFVQFVGSIHDRVIKDVEEKVQLRRSQGRRAWYCIVNGQDTARLLYAYGKA